MARHACTNPPMLSQLFTETLRGKVAAVVYDFNVALPRVNTLPSPQSVKWNTRKDFVYISSERGFVLSNDDLERLIFQYLLLLSRLRVIFVRFFSLLLYIYIYFFSLGNFNFPRKFYKFDLFRKKHGQHIFTLDKRKFNSTYGGDYLY